MKILFIDVQIDLLGGGSMHSLNITASELSKMGHDVSVITLNPERSRIFENPPYNIIKEKRWFTDPVTTDIFVYKLLKRHAPDVDVFHIYDPALLGGGGLYRLKGGIKPVFGTLNSYSFCTNYGMMNGGCHKTCNLIKRISHSQYKIHKKIISLPFRIYQQYIGFWLAKKTDWFFPDSTVTMKIYSEFGFDKSRMTVIPEMIDVEGLQNKYNIRTKPPRDNKKFNVLFVGRLEQPKGVDILIKAISKSDIPDIHLHIVGDGNERATLQKLCRRLNVENKITFHGWARNEAIHKYYLQSQLFVHPGRWPEPFGRTVIEAMCFGMPTIVSDTGAPKWLVGNAGLIFKTQDIAELKEKITKIYSDIMLRKRLSINARARAEDFNYKKSIKQLVNAYKKFNM